MNETPSRTSHEEHRRRQAVLLQRLLDLLAADARVLGLAARGSYVRGATDAFSDLDMRCYFRDEDGVRLDLDYFPRSRVARDRRESSKILLDPDGVLANELGSAYAPEHRAHPRWWEPGDAAYVTWFL